MACTRSFSGGISMDSHLPMVNSDASTNAPEPRPKPKQKIESMVRILKCFIASLFINWFFGMFQWLSLLELIVIRSRWLAEMG